MGDPGQRGIRRRTFLEGSALAAAVAMLEACGRDEVQYLVQPLERPEGRPGEGVWKQSVCGQCAAGCGTMVRVVDGDARKVEGIRAHPINHGGLCAIGQAALQSHYDPDRVTRPLVRAGAATEAPEGRAKDRSGALEPAEWDTALAAAAEAIARAAARDPQSIVFVDGSGNTFLHAMLARLAYALGAPPPVVLESAQAEVERRASRLALGFASAAAYDLSRADYILSIGPAFLDRGPQPAWATWAMSEVRGGTPGRRGKLVQAESRMSLTGAFADEWLPVKPGEEGTLARTIAGVLLAEAPGRGDETAYRAISQQPLPSLEEGAKRCDLPPRTIRRIARELLRAERPVVLGGGSAALQRDGLASTTSALALNHLLGAVGRDGGVRPSATYGVAVTLLPPGADHAMNTNALEARLRGIGDVPSVLVVCEGDPAHTRPPARGWREGLGKVDTIITLTTALDDTASQADLVLPVHSDIERFHAVEPAGLPFPALSVGKAAAKPIGDSRHPGDIVLALATALERKADLPWDTFEAMVEQAVNGAAAAFGDAAGADASQAWNGALERGGIWSEGLPAAASAAATAAPPAVGAAATASAAAAGASDSASPVLGEPIPDEVTVAAAPASTEGAFTLLLFESPKYGDGRGANKAWLQELPDTLTTVMWSGWAEVATSDGERLGISTGDLLELKTGAGTIQVPAVIRPEARPGTIAVPLGTGHRDYGRYARGRGANPLDLIGVENVEGTTAPVLSANVEARRVGRSKVAIYGRGLRQAEHIPTGWAPMDKGH
jgi:anaerobic selenocysteine-containing dehydrogenase